MGLPGFYNDNAARSYPLVPFSGVPVNVTPAFVLPLDTLVDFGCLVGLDAEYDETQHTVYLHAIIRAGNMFTFDFRSAAPGLVDYALRFSRNLADPEYATDYAAAVFLGGPTTGQAPLWEGFLATGPLDSLAAAVASDGVLVILPGPQVEPALVQNLGKSYLRTVSLANQDRTRALPPAGCPGSETPQDYTYIINATGLVGDLRFKEGYNISIRQNNRNNSITFAALQGAGAGTQCAEVPLYKGEQPPAGSSVLSGGPACDEVVTSLNGLTASIIQLVPQLGTVITPAPSNVPNTLIVNFDRNNMTVCGAIATVVENLEEELAEELVDG